MHGRACGHRGVVLRLAGARRGAGGGRRRLPRLRQFYSSPTKPQAVRAQPALLAEARRLGRPLVAIGGITAANAAPLVQAGADALAVISSVFLAEDPQAAAHEFEVL